MKIVLFGQTGMVGAGALRECLHSAEVDAVLSVVRRPSRPHGLDPCDPKLPELVHENFGDFSSIASECADLDACIWCVGVTALGRAARASTRASRTTSPWPLRRRCHA